MKIVNLKVPDEIKMTEDELLEFMAAKLYESKRISLKEASDIARVSETELAEILGKYNVEIVKEPLPKRTRDAGQF